MRVLQINLRKLINETYRSSDKIELYSYYYLNPGFISPQEIIAEIEMRSNEEMGFGSVDSMENDPPNLYSYRLAEKGIKYVEENILENISKQQREYLRKFKRKINTLSLDSILSYVYNKYPNAAENSLIRSDYIAEAGAEND